MSRIDELIAALCPDGVEFKRLWQVTSWDKKFNAVDRSKQPRVLKYSYFLASDLKPLVVHGGSVKLLTTNSSDIWTTEELAGDLLSEGEIVAIPWGGNPNVQYFKGKFLTADNRIAVSNDPNTLDTKFLYYFMQGNLDVLASFYRGSGIKHPSMSQVLDMVIPVPPLEVQHEIVRVLDLFTTLEAELEAELEARRRQYAHYRDSLLSFPEGVRWVPMGEVGEFIRGRRFVRTDMADTGIPAIHYGEIYTHYGVSTDNTLSHVRSGLAPQLRHAQSGDVVIAAVGETVEDVGKAVAWLGDDSVAIHDDCFAYRHSMNPKFVSYYLQTEAFHSQKSRFVARAKVKRLSSADLAKITIPVPPLDEQARIVTILDTFDPLVNDLSIGLPAELAARRKQYEYYRDRLLTFEEAVA